MPITTAGEQDLTDRVYPSFNDAPHERPGLGYEGTGRALVILVGVLGSIIALALLLTLVR